MFIQSDSINFWGKLPSTWARIERWLSQIYGRYTKLCLSVHATLITKWSLKRLKRVMLMLSKNCQIWIKKLFRGMLIEKKVFRETCHSLLRHSANLLKLKLNFKLTEKKWTNNVWSINKKLKTKPFWGCTSRIKSTSYTM